MKNQAPKQITNERHMVKFSTFLGSQLTSRWFATKEEAEDYAIAMVAKPGTEIFTKQTIVGYSSFEKFGRVFKSEIWG